jgi:hypothetical protein
MQKQLSKKSHKATESSIDDFMKHIQDIKNILKFPSILKEDTYQKYIVSNIFSISSQE